jgi:hypothetical protein
MNTEKIEKLKKGLTNSQIPENLKQKIREQIAKLESEIKTDEGMTATEVKKEVTKIEKKVDDSVEVVEKKIEKQKIAEAKKNSTAKPSKTNKPKRTAMSLAKEIRKDGESWKDAMARASKMMKEKTHTATKDVESELEKLTKLVRSKKELKGQLGQTNLLRDAKRKALPSGKRISYTGEVYYENRANRTDKGTYGKYHLEKGGKFETPFNVIYTTKSGRTMVASNIMALNEEQAKEKLKQQMRASESFDKIVMAHKSFEDGGNIEDDKFKKFISSQITYIISLKTISQKKEPIKNLLNNMEDYKSGSEIVKRITSDNLKYALKQNTVLKINEVLRISLNALEYADGGYLTDPNFGNFQNTMFADGGGIPNNYEGKTPEQVWDMWTPNQREHFLADHYDVMDGKDLGAKNKSFEELNFLTQSQLELHIEQGQYAKGGEISSKQLDLGYQYSFEKDEDNVGSLYKEGGVYSVIGFENGKHFSESFEKFSEAKKFYLDKKGKVKFELGGNVVTDLAGHTGGSLGTGDPSMLDGFSNTGYDGLVGETGAMSSGEMFMNGGGLPSGSEQSYMITEALGNPAQHYEVGGTLKIKKTGRYKILGEIKGQEPILYASTNDKNLIKSLVDMAEIDLNKLTGKKYHIFVTDEFTDDEVFYYKSGGMLDANERYVLEIKGLTGLRKETIERYIEENRLSDNDVLNIVIGLGRKQLKRTDVASAVVGKKGNDLSKKVIEFAKDNKGMKLYDGGEFQSGVYANGGSLIGNQKRIDLNKNGKIDAEDFKLLRTTMNGAWRNEHEHINSSDHKQDYEVRYARKHKSDRTGYKGKTYANGGGVDRFSEYSNDALYDMIINLSRYENTESEIEMVKAELEKRKGENLDFQQEEVTYFINKDGIKVRSVAKPKKELSEAEWMAKHSESKEARGYAKGGAFEKLSNKVARNYEGKRVKPQYQKEYGKVYSKSEAKEVGNKVAGKVKAMKKAESGTEVRKGAKGGIMVLAKQIRKEGESWQDAVKRAGQQLK